MSESYFDIKITSGIEPKGEDSDFPILKSHHVETAENQRLDDKLVGIDNQFALDNQKIDAESARLDGRITTTTEELNNKIDANRDEVDGEIGAVNEHLTQTDARLAQEVTDRVNFGHAVNNELAKINTAISGINDTVGDVTNTVNAVKVECNQYTDSQLSATTLDFNQKLAEESSARQTADLTLQGLVNNKVDATLFNQYTDDVAEDIRVINTALCAIPDTYATKAELSVKADASELNAYKNLINSEVDSVKGRLNIIEGDYLKEADKTELEEDIAKRVLQSDYNTALSNIESRLADKASVGSVSTVEGKVTALENTVAANTAAIAGKLDVATYNEDKATFALKSEIEGFATEADVNAAISSKADATVVNELSSEVDTLSATLNNSVEDLSTDLTEAVATLEGKIRTAQLNAEANAGRQLTIYKNANDPRVEALESGKADKSELANYVLKSDTPNVASSVLFTIDTIVGFDVGGFHTGDNLKGKTLRELFAQLLVEGGIAVTGISIDKTTAQLAPGGSVVLNAIITPDDATNNHVEWTVEGNNVSLSVTSGLSVTVSANAEGSAVVRATVSSFTAECNISVVAEQDLDPVDVIQENSLAIQIGTADGTSAKPFGILTEATAADPTNEGFFDFGDKAGYQLISPTTGRKDVNIALPSVATLRDLEYYNVLTSAWEPWLPDANPRWTAGDTTTIDNVNYTNYVINAKGTGLSVRFIIE